MVTVTDMAMVTDMAATAPSRSKAVYTKYIISHRVTEVAKL